VIFALQAEGRGGAIRFESLNSHGYKSLIISDYEAFFFVCQTIENAGLNTIQTS